MYNKLRVAILGSGNIGTDLLMKLRRSKLLECSLFIGRNRSSLGIRTAQELGVPVSYNSIDAIVKDPNCCDIVFDCTSASEHIKNWPIFQRFGKRVIDMTPSRVGEMTVPAINLEQIKNSMNVNMVSCGGQASIPLAFAISQSQPGIEYIEVVSSIASKSAGPATRLNLDEYVETTEAALKSFCHCRKTKTILILNPSEPAVNMQTTISAKVRTADLNLVRPAVEEMVSRIQRYVPGYQLLVPPVFENNRIVTMVKVTGLGDYLPPFAGNLDIINCAAIATAEFFAEHVYE